VSSFCFDELRASGSPSRREVDEPTAPAKPVGQTQQMESWSPFSSRSSTVRNVSNISGAPGSWCDLELGAGIPTQLPFIDRPSLSSGTN